MKVIEDGFVHLKTVKIAAVGPRGDAPTSASIIRGPTRGQ